MLSAIDTACRPRVSLTSRVTFEGFITAITELILDSPRQILYALAVRCYSYAAATNSFRRLLLKHNNISCLVRMSRSYRDILNIQIPRYSPIFFDSSLMCFRWKGRGRIERTRSKLGLSRLADMVEHDGKWSTFVRSLFGLEGKEEGELFLRITPVGRPRNIDKRGKEWSHVGVDIRYKRDPFLCSVLFSSIVPINPINYCRSFALPLRN